MECAWVGAGRGPGVDLAVDAAAANVGRWAAHVHSAYFGGLPASCGGCSAEAPAAAGDAHIRRCRGGLRLSYSLAAGTDGTWQADLEAGCLI